MEHLYHPIALTGLLAIAAWLDARSRKLPNWLAGAILLVGIIQIAFLGDWANIGWHFAHGGIALVIGMILFAIGWVGGGDAKTYAALAVSFPLAHALPLLGTVSIAMLILAVFWIAVHRWKRRRAGQSKPKSKDDFAKIPLGVAIAAGGIIQLWPL